MDDRSMAIDLDGQLAEFEDGRRSSVLRERRYQDAIAWLHDFYLRVWAEGEGPNSP